MNTFSLEDSCLLDRIIPKIRFDSDTGCWVWTGSKTKHGQAQMSSQHGKSPHLVHRVMYRIYIGFLEPTKCICHKCDNPACVNPKHLFQDTQSANILDAAQKKRIGGIHHHKTKLTEADVLDIRSSDLEVTELAKRFAMHPESIRSIKTGRTWLYTPGATQSLGIRRGADHSSSKLSENDAREILDSKLSISELAAIFGVHDNTVRDIKCGRTWKHLRGPIEPPKRHNKAKLTEQDVLAIRANTTDTLQVLADQYNVSIGTISLIRNRRTWKHV